MQLISKIYLKMHTNLKWHILNSKDKKMVATASTKISEMLALVLLWGSCQGLRHPP